MKRSLQGKIELATEFEGYELLWYWTHGHVDPAEFVNEILIEYEEEFTIDDVEHIYVRKVPVSGMSSYMMIYRAEKSRGAFKATVIDKESIPISDNKSGH